MIFLQSPRSSQWAARFLKLVAVPPARNPRESPSRVAPSVTRTLSLGVIVVVAACGDSGTEPLGRTVAVVEPFAGADQRALVGESLPEPVVVRLLDEGGLPVVGATVTFAPAEGHGAANPWAASSDSAGLATTMWTLGAAVGEQVLVATVQEGVSTEVRAWAVTALPDLVASLSPSGVRMWPGGSFDYVATIRNRGDTVATVTQANTFASIDSVITTSDERVGSPSDVPELGPGESASRMASFRVSSSSVPGTVFYVGECVEPLEWESSKDNNCSAALKVTVTDVPAPDLVVGVSPDSVMVVPRGSFEYVTAVRNDGDMASVATRTNLFVSNDSIITTSDESVGSPYEVPGLDPGESVSRATRLPVISSAVPGTVLYIGECVEPVEGESDTGNNCSGAIKVTVTGWPDLVATVSLDSVSVGAGGRFSYQVEVGNRGDATAPATKVRTFVSPDPVITRSDEIVSDASRVPALDPGDFVRGTASVTVSSSASPGTVVYVGECVDPVEGESDMMNNCSRAIKLTILMTGSLRAAESSVAQSSGRRGSRAEAMSGSAVSQTVGKIELLRVARSSPLHRSRSFLHSQGRRRMNRRTTGAARHLRRRIVAGCADDVTEPSGGASVQIAQGVAVRIRSRCWPTESWPVPSRDRHPGRRGTGPGARDDRLAAWVAERTTGTSYIVAN